LNRSQDQEGRPPELFGAKVARTRRKTSRAPPETVKAGEGAGKPSDLLRRDTEIEDAPETAGNPSRTLKIG
jgi:hypothetical protein